MVRRPSGELAPQAGRLSLAPRRCARCRRDGTGGDSPHDVARRPTPLGRSWCAPAPPGTVRCGWPTNCAASCKPGPPRSAPPASTPGVHPPLPLPDTPSITDQLRTAGVSHAAARPRSAVHTAGSRTNSLKSLQLRIGQQLEFSFQTLSRSASAAFPRYTIPASHGRAVRTEGPRKGHARHRRCRPVRTLICTDVALSAAHLLGRSGRTRQNVSTVQDRRPDGMSTSQ
jgi:hypothetical protein